MTQGDADNHPADHDHHPPHHETPSPEGAHATHGAQRALEERRAEAGAQHGPHAAEHAAAAHAGHGGGDHAAVFRRRFWVSLVLSVPVFVYSEMLQEWLNFEAPAFPGDEFVEPLF